MSVARPYWLGDQKRMAWGLLALLVGLMVLETQLAVMLIDKTGELTSALAAKQVDRFWSAVRASLMVVAVAVPVYAFYYYMRDAFSNHWRRWLTHRFLDGYLSERKYYDIGNARDIDNPDQRISEDINTFTGRSTHFLLIFLGSLMQLVAFSAVLWSISHTLVAFLAVYALLGTFGALYLFGAPLIRLNFWQIRREADFRFGLMRLRENAESIAFYRGEPQERAQLNQRFEAVFSNFAKLIKKQRSLNLYQRGFSQLTLVLPAIILANDVLSGELEVGRAIQAAGAVGQGGQEGDGGDGALLLRGRGLSPPRPGDRGPRDPALRVPDQLHALSAGNRAGHAADAVRIPEPGRAAARHRRCQCVDVRRLDRVLGSDREGAADHQARQGAAVDRAAPALPQRCAHDGEIYRRCAGRWRSQP